MDTHGPLMQKYSTLAEALLNHTPCPVPHTDGPDLMRVIVKENPTATHAVLFVNQDFGSSQFGHYAVLAVGPDQTYKSISEVEGGHLNDLPSQRMYPVAYTEIRKDQNGQ